MTAFMIASVVKARHSRPDIGHRLSVLPGEEMILGWVIPTFGAAAPPATGVRADRVWRVHLVLRCAALYPDPPLLQATPRFEHARSLADLREGLTVLWREWVAFEQINLITDLLDRPLMTEEVYEPGTLCPERFMTDLDPAKVNHIGERLTRPDGELLYLKTFQLSAVQTRRAYLLQLLAQYEWHLGNAAAGLKATVPELVSRIGWAAGFGYLLAQAVRKTAAKALRGTSSSTDPEEACRGTWNSQFRLPHANRC